MEVEPIPAGFHTVTPYLMVNGAEKLIAFLTKALDAQTKTLSRHDDGTIMHVTLQVGDSMVMMTDARPVSLAEPSSFYLYVPRVDETYQQAMAAGGESIRPTRDEFHGDRMAGVKDPCGNTWWIATHIEDVSDEELERRRKKMGKK